MATRRLVFVLLVVFVGSCGTGSKNPGFTPDMISGQDLPPGDHNPDNQIPDIINDKGLPDTSGNELPADAANHDAVDAQSDHGTGELPDSGGKDVTPETVPPETVEEPVCVPDCPTLSCGPDGCGGLCGCPDGYECPVQESFTCAPKCELLCAGRLCGKAGVNQECDCGVCEDNNACTDNVCDAQGSCSYPANMGPCDDADPCTGDDVCLDGNCHGTMLGLAELVAANCICAEDKDCLRFDDGNACNGTLRCVEAQGVKVCNLDPSTVPVCDDLNPCTKDSCQPKTGCVRENVDVACSDANPCTLGDWCSAGVCVPGQNQKDCDDGELCTDDTCNPAVPDGCVNLNNSLNCEDGNPCSLGDKCLNGTCVGGVQEKDCNDGNVCTDDSCDPKTPGGCKYVFNTKACLDGDPCTLAEVCKDGVCVGTGTLSCEDHNACTKDSCVTGKGCSNTPMAGSCDDGDSCTDGDTCSNGVCISGANKCTCSKDDDCKRFDDLDYCNGSYSCNIVKQVCGLGSPVKCPPPAVPVCTANKCDPKDGVCKLSNTNDGQPCDDKNPCTLGDLCAIGTCKAGLAAPDCDDKNPCTDDSCDPKVAGGCVHTNNTRPCDDKNPCTLVDFCYEGQCIPGGTPKDCNDNNVCTTDTCDPLTAEGCVHTPVGGNCEDGDPCSLGDYCSEGICRTGKTIKNCNDNNVCTSETCIAWQGCQYLHAPGTCNDGNACTYADTCQNKVCVGNSYTCNAPGFCEKLPGTCDGKGGCSYPANTGASCSDNNLCTHTDKCQSDKKCVGTTYTCTSPGFCETATGAACKGDGTCTYPANTGASCTDNNLCTHTDRCQSDKKCVGTTYTCTSPGICETATGATCNGNGGCNYPANTGAACTDNNLCTHTDKCQSNKSCIGTSYQCTTPGKCETATGATCNGSGGCNYPAATGTGCDDAKACTHTDKCQSDKSCAGTAYKCESPGYCEKSPGTCNGTGGCTYAADIGLACNDGNICSYGDACQASKICAGAVYSCNTPTPPCEKLPGTCNGAGGCTYTANAGANCDDGKSCTFNDKCQNDKSCAGTGYQCNQPGKCETATGAICLGDGNCTYLPNTNASCDDGNPCTHTDTCKADKTCSGKPCTLCIANNCTIQ